MLTQGFVQIVHLIVDIVATESVSGLQDFRMQLLCFDATGVLVMPRFEHVLDSRR